MKWDIVLVQGIVFALWVSILYICYLLWKTGTRHQLLLVPIALWSSFGMVFYILVWTGVVPTGSELAIRLSAVGRLFDATLVLAIVLLWKYLYSTK